jgi:hypothetical protein
MDSNYLRVFREAIEQTIKRSREGETGGVRVMFLRLGVVQRSLYKNQASSEHSVTSFAETVQQLGQSAMSMEGDFHLIFAGRSYSEAQLLEVSQLLALKYYAGVPSAPDPVAEARSSLSLPGVQTALRALVMAQQDFDAAVVRHVRPQ